MGVPRGWGLKKQAIKWIWELMETLSLLLVFLKSWRMSYMCTMCVCCLHVDSLSVHVGWLSGASGATEWLTSPQMVLRINETAHLIVNLSLYNNTNMCVRLFVRPFLWLSPALCLFPNSVFATVFHLTVSISLWSTSSRSPTAGLWSAL